MDNLQTDWNSERILKLRTAMNLSRGAFARIIRVTKQAVFNWEKKGAKPHAIAQNKLNELEENRKQ